MRRIRGRVWIGYGRIRIEEQWWRWNEEEEVLRDGKENLFMGRGIYLKGNQDGNLGGRQKRREKGSGLGGKKGEREHRERARKGVGKWRKINGE